MFRTTAQTGFVAISMSNRHRVRERRHGRRDGRRNIPDLAQHDGGARGIRSPHLDELTSSEQETIEHERQRAITDTAPQRTGLGALHVRLELVEQALLENASALEGMQLNPEALTVRVPGEDRLGDWVVRKRRHNDAEASMAPLRAAEQALRAERNHIRTRIGEFNDAVAARVRLAQSRAERFQAFSAARRNWYLTSLARHHPQGGRIADLAELRSQISPGSPRQISGCPYRTSPHLDTRSTTNEVAILRERRLAARTELARWHSVAALAPLGTAHRRLRHSGAAHLDGTLHGAGHDALRGAPRCPRRRQRKRARRTDRPRPRQGFASSSAGIRLVPRDSGLLGRTSPGPGQCSECHCRRPRDADRAAEEQLAEVDRILAARELSMFDIAEMQKEPTS